MSTNYGALCTDFSINQRLDLKMDLPSERETLMNLFDRVKKQFPAMNRFRRGAHELVLESEATVRAAAESGGAAGSGEGLARQQWLSLRRTSVRTGTTNPTSTKEAYALHKTVLEVLPYFLALSALDVEYLEVVYGFELLSSSNHDQIVLDVLYPQSPLATLLGMKGAMPIDCQPTIGLSLPDPAGGDVSAYFQIKTRPSAEQHQRSGAGGAAGAAGAGGAGGAAKAEWSPEKDAEKLDVPPEPLSVFVTIRKEGPIDDIAQLPTMFKSITSIGEKLLETKIIPNLIVPIRDAIASSNS